MRRAALASTLLYALTQVGGCAGKSIVEERGLGNATGGAGGETGGAGSSAGRGGSGTNTGGARAGTSGSTGDGSGGSANGGGASSSSGASSGSGGAPDDGAAGSGGSNHAAGSSNHGDGGTRQGGGGATDGEASDGGDATNGGAGGEAPLEDTGDIVATDLVVDLDTKTATATITLAASTAASATFEVGDLELDSVSVAGGTVGLERREQRLRVEYPPSSEPVVLTFAYHYRAHEDFDGVSSSGYTFTWPYFCGNVFPCHSGPADGTRFTLSVTGGGTDELVYPARIDADAPSYMLAWAAGPYRPLELGTTAAGTHLVGYYLDDENGGSANLASGAVNVVTAFDWLEQRYGAYAFGSEAGPVAVRWQDSAFDGMEHHPFWHVRESESFDQLTELHELAHGWFGDGVRIRCWEDFVLSEGLASYLAARLSNELGAFPVDMWSEYEVVLSQGLATDASVAWPEGCNQIDVLTSGLDSNMTYVKGALFLRELEKRVGTDAFDAALAYFYERWVGKAAGVQDLLDAVEHSSGYHAEECANHWLRTLSPREQACP